MVVTRPQDRLLIALDPAADPPLPLEPEPVYARVEPGPHPSDEGRDLKVLRGFGDELRRVVHDQLMTDLAAMDLPTRDVKLDFRSARTRKKSRTATVHGGEMCEMTGVVARTPDGEELHRAAVSFTWDALADEFHAFFERVDGLPLHVWESLDMGVKRRMVGASTWAADPRVQGFAGGRETTSV